MAFGSGSDGSCGRCQAAEGMPAVGLCAASVNGGANARTGMRAVPSVEQVSGAVAGVAHGLV